MDKKLVVKLLGVLFLAFGIAAILNTIFNLEQGLAPILWFSYIGLILLAIGMLRGDGYLIASQICILAIPYIFWNFDFFYYLFAGNSFFGIVDYVFAPGPLLGKIITAQHLFNIPLSLVALHLVGLKRKDGWKLSFIEVFILFFVTRAVTDFDKNVNCVYHNCANFDLGVYYPIQWFLTYFAMIIITNIVLTGLFYKNEQR